ncbi:Acetoin catabolism protein X [Euzebya pacifica]|uniref:Acetoin catabolism protein X n=1 Tax=Euzebya pacifica TaxID=1608957 RepID=A0A346XSS4_9ACTN|nr:NAD(+)/NADH kinase [Euzebya pacifica]AXV05271.1 Acetoin catabolism protein X [Euzebya pacifica]
MGVVGLVANPASARDIRRLVADGAAVTTHDKLNIVRRVLAGLGSVGVERVLSMQDGGGISAGLASMVDRPSADTWPEVAFVNHPVTQTAVDTVSAVTSMVRAGVGAIVVIGGDGTNRKVLSACGDTPLMPLSTGTNNAFPQPAEASVAGIAAGLVALGRVRPVDAGTPARWLTVQHGARVHHAVVDVAVTRADGTGAGAVTDAAEVCELYLCLAEPHSIGLSAIGAHLRPVGRDDADGLIVRLGQPAVARVRAPIAPGRLVDVDVAAVQTLHANQPIRVTATAGVLAIDGERIFRFGPADVPMVTLHGNGPVVIDVARTMRHAACSGLLSLPPRRSPDRADRTCPQPPPTQPARGPAVALQASVPQEPTH